MALGRDPIGNARTLTTEELQVAFRPVRFFNGIPVFRQGSTTLLLLQSALRNYGRLYYTYKDYNLHPHLVNFNNNELLFETVSEQDEAYLANLVHDYSFASRYLRNLNSIL